MIVVATFGSAALLRSQAIAESRRGLAGLTLVLAEQAGKVVTHRRLLAAGWGRADTDPQYLRTYMGMLRQKLDAAGGAAGLIHNEPGMGYRLMVSG